MSMHRRALGEHRRRARAHAATPLRSERRRSPLVVVGVLLAGAMLVCVPSLQAVADTPRTGKAQRATAATTPGYTLWSAAARPQVAVTRTSARSELGTQFAVVAAGTVTALRFYKSRRNTGSHVGSLYDADGHRLASVTFRRESRSGWQTARLKRPVVLAPGTTYTVSYRAPRGHFSRTDGYFPGDHQLGGGLLTAVGSTVGRPGRMPRTASASAYFVDVVFVPPRAAGTGPASPNASVGDDEPTTDDPTTMSFPNASTTGARGPLTTRPGGTITTNGTVIQNARITGQLTIRADDVVLRNVVIDVSDSYGVLTYGRRTVIEDADIRGTAGQTLAGVAAYEAGSVLARRIDVSGSEDGVRLADDSLLADSYVHDLAGTSSSHFDAVTADGYRRWTIRHNTILNDYDQTAAVWIGDPRYSPSEGVLANNLLAGGGFTLYAGPGTGTGLQVVGNVFSQRMHASGGYWGPVTYWAPSGNTWTGNVWADGTRAGQAVQP